MEEIKFEDAALKLHFLKGMELSSIVRINMDIYLEFNPTKNDSGRKKRTLLRINCVFRLCDAKRVVTGSGDLLHWCHIPIVGTLCFFDLKIVAHRRKFEKNIVCDVKITEDKNLVIQLKKSEIQIFKACGYDMDCIILNNGETIVK